VTVEAGVGAEAATGKLALAKVLAAWIARDDVGFVCGEGSRGTYDFCPFSFSLSITSGLQVTFFSTFCLYFFFNADGNGDDVSCSIGGIF
jgi:hypothetical protein